MRHAKAAPELADFSSPGTRMYSRTGAQKGPELPFRDEKQGSSVDGAFLARVFSVSMQGWSGAVICTACLCGTSVLAAGLHAFRGSDP